MTIDILSRINWTDDIQHLQGRQGLPIQIGFEGKDSKGIEAHHCKQVHGTHPVQANEDTTGPHSSSRPEADAIWTFQKKAGTESIAVKTADCLPVLFFIPNQEKNTPAKIAAAHAGWRGLAKGILRQTFEVLTPQLRPEQVQQSYAFFGPCIGPERFEVGPEVVEAFRAASPFDISFCLTKGLRDRWFFDLAAYGAYELVQAGMIPERIHVLRSCTYSRGDLWFSSRRKDYQSSNWSWISILPGVNR